MEIKFLFLFEMVNFNADMDGAKEPGLSASIADEECFGSIAIIRKNKDTEIFKMREPMCIIGRYNLAFAFF